MKKVLYISDLDWNGSGYSTITRKLASGLSSLCEVKVVALSYRYQEHNFPFSVFPAGNVQDVMGYVVNLVNIWRPDVVVVALDIPMHEFFIPKIKKLGVPYIAITPLESDPLCLPWAAVLMQADRLYFISRFGTNEARKVGLDAHHLKVGIDLDEWGRRTDEEYKISREKIYGIADDVFLVLMVADNQERKNLQAALRSIAILKDKYKIEKIKLAIVTRTNMQIGWDLHDLARTLGIGSEYVEFQRGMQQQHLRLMYCGADLYLNTSKGEGLGVPILEAMAVGVPVVASAVGACVDHISDGGGYLIESEYSYVDPYGNATRYYVDIEQVADVIYSVIVGSADWRNEVDAARAYVDTLIWDIPVNDLYKAISEVRYAQV